MQNTKKDQVVDCGSGKFQFRTYNKKSEHYNESELDVEAFEKQYVCHPIEAHIFYPEQFVTPYVACDVASSWSASQLRKAL